jgi:hypothetical protein
VSTPSGTAPQGSIRHPLNRNAYYAPDGEGGVLVTAGDRWGRFKADGRYVAGPLFEADPELCVWVSSRRPSSHHRLTDLTGER